MRGLQETLEDIFDDPTVEAVWAVYNDVDQLRVWLALHRERDDADGGIGLAASLVDDLSPEEMDGKYVMASFALPSAELLQLPEQAEGINSLDLLMGEVGEGGGLATWRYEGRSNAAPRFPHQTSIRAVFVYRFGDLPLVWECERGTVAQHIAITAY